ncbi:hypothetical protein IKQ21_02780 [bacterium]|nr:hypothetical protein [bacterium]
MAFENFNAYPQKPMPKPNTAGQSSGDGNNSGQGPNTPVPDVVAKRFNWGACLLNWIWGLGNKTYITLLIFLVSAIPIINFIAPLVMIIWFGIKGNTWAWQNKRFQSVEHFHAYQKKWAIAAVIIQLILIPLAIVGIGAAIIMPSMLGNVDSAKSRVATLKSANVAQEVVLINQSTGEKCVLTSEGIAACFEKRMNISNKMGSTLTSADGTIWSFVGDGTCLDSGICSVTVMDKGKILFTLPLYVNENGYIAINEDAVQDIIDAASK